MPAMMNVGSKAQVFHGTAMKTSGGLKKEDLMQNKNGRIVSKKAHAAGLVAVKRLRNAGFVAQKGVFKLFTPKKRASLKVSPSKSRASTMKNSPKKNSPKKSVKAKKAKKVAIPKRTMKTRAMKKANHNKRHNAAVRAWTKRHAAKAPVGGRKH